MTTYKDGKRINLVYVLPSTFDWLVSESNKKGDNLAHYIGTVLDDVVEGKLEYSESTRTKVARDMRALRDKDQMRREALEAAVIYRHNPSQETADLLKRVCDNAQVDYDDALEEIDGDPFSSLIHNVRTGNAKFRECMEWLTTHLTAHNGQLPSNAIMTVGGLQGYNQNLLNRVKRMIALDPDTPTIQSEKRDNIWWWVIQHVNQDVKNGVVH